MNHFASRDERETVVDRQGDRLSYVVLSVGLLGIVAYRSVVDRTASWDLLALVIISGVVGTAYRAAQRTVTGSWLVVAVGTAAIALVLAAMTAFGARP